MRPELDKSLLVVFEKNDESLPDHEFTQSVLNRLPKHPFTALFVLRWLSIIVVGYFSLPYIQSWLGLASTQFSAQLSSVFNQVAQVANIQDTDNLMTAAIFVGVAIVIGWKKARDY